MKIGKVFASGSSRCSCTSYVALRGALRGKTPTGFVKTNRNFAKIWSLIIACTVVAKASQCAELPKSSPLANLEHSTPQLVRLFTTEASMSHLVENVDNPVTNVDDADKQRLAGCTDFIKEACNIQKVLVETFKEFLWSEIWNSNRWDAKDLPLLASNDFTTFPSHVQDVYIEMIYKQYPKLKGRRFIVQSAIHQYWASVDDDDKKRCDKKRRPEFANFIKEASDIQGVEVKEFTTFLKEETWSTDHVQLLAQRNYEFISLPPTVQDVFIAQVYIQYPRLKGRRFITQNALRQHWKNRRRSKTTPRWAAAGGVSASQGNNQ